MSGLSIGVDLLERLSRAYPAAIAGVKDSSGSLDNMRRIVARFPQLSVLTGDDDLLLPLLRTGGAGSITAGANIAPHSVSYIYANWRSDDAAVRKRQAMLQRLWSGLLLKYPVTEVLKEILAAESGNDLWRNVRPPLCSLPPEVRNQLQQAWRDIEFPMIETERHVLDS